MNIELEITLRCNAKCMCCSRHCHYISYGDSDMTLPQIDKFISDVRNHGDIKNISIMGGEPTVHPFLEKIALKINKDLLETDVVKLVQIVTNGKIQIPDSIRNTKIGVDISREEDKSILHRCQFVAPIDTGQELKDSCDIPDVCGISLNKFGYNPCGAGGAIARLFGLNKYINYEMPGSPRDFGDLTDLCNLCQVKAKRYMMCADYGVIYSRSFKEAFDSFKKNNPKFKEWA